jgi:nucleotide-binding universal stress UspA family protein
MRILIGYDGSVASQAALSDLRHAGLPANTVALVVTVAHGSMSKRKMADAEKTALECTAALRTDFPKWIIASETALGQPPGRMLEIAETFRPDLIIVGERRHRLDEDVLIGHTSHTLLTDARCSVRIARGDIARASRPVHIVVGFDGSSGSTRAVESIASRSWPRGPDVRLSSVADASVLAAIGRFKPQMANATVQTKFASQWAESLAASSTATLKAAGIRSSVELRLGHAKEVIVEDAAEWNADMIFVGPHCTGDSFERFLLGSVSAAVAARAHCSVEVVRC